MHWNCPKRGDERVIEKFLFFPRTIGTEKRWLEFAKIRQRYDSAGIAKTEKVWKDVAWVEPN